MDEMFYGATEFNQQMCWLMPSKKVEKDVFDGNVCSPSCIECHFCGISLDDASQCNDNDVCPSGSDSDCSLGESCYGVEVCNKHSS